MVRRGDHSSGFKGTWVPDTSIGFSLITYHRQASPPRNVCASSLHRLLSGRNVQCNCTLPTILTGIHVRTLHPCSPPNLGTRCDRAESSREAAVRVRWATLADRYIPIMFHVCMIVAGRAMTSIERGNRVGRLYQGSTRTSTPPSSIACIDRASHLSVAQNTAGAREYAPQIDGLIGSARSIPFGQGGRRQAGVIHALALVDPLCDGVCIASYGGVGIPNRYKPASSSPWNLLPLLHSSATATRPPAACRW